jgi:hypothetical protein
VEEVMRAIAAACFIAILATPAFAQFDAGIIKSDMNEKPFKTDVEIKREQERENSYKAGIAKIPNGKASQDPWGNVRPDAKPTLGKPVANQKKPTASQ